MEYVFVEDTDQGLEFRGGALALLDCRDEHVIIAGPAETGKTFAALCKLDWMCWKYPGLRVLMTRLTYASLKASAVVTYESKVLGAHDEHGEFDSTLTPVRKLGGENPVKFIYPNGSTIVLAGLDKPGKTLSAEYDVIYINQVEECSLEAWELLMTRCTGRAGNLPWGSQMMGDANPGPPSHWIITLRDTGRITFFESRHEDNPMLHDGTTWTAQGRKSLGILDKLSGARKQRLRYGRWVQAEGVVYEEFDRAIHVIPREALPAGTRNIAVVDFGFRDPFVCTWWRIVDDRMYRYRELYMTGRLVEDHARQMKELEADDEHIEATICDHDAEDRATLERHLGRRVIKAFKSIKPGIEQVQSRLRVDETGRAALFFVDDSLVEVDTTLLDEHKPVCTEQEFEVYVWTPGKDGKPLKEQPVDLNNHGLDTVRYGVAYVDGLSSASPPSSGMMNPWG